MQRFYNYKKTAIWLFTPGLIIQIHIYCFLLCIIAHFLCAVTASPDTGKREKFSNKVVVDAWVRHRTSTQQTEVCVAPEAESHDF